MIVYLNFAPIDFIGGAELWLRGIARATSKYEDVYVLSVAPSLSDKYGEIVLHRKFSENRTPDKLEDVSVLSLDLASFLPFTSKYWKIRRLLKNARLIYIKLELLEVLIVLYFTSIYSLRKVIGGVHSPLNYKITDTFFSKLHNLVYTSSLYGFIIRRLHKVHVLNKKDYIFLQDTYNVKNIIQLYDGVDINKEEKFNEEINEKKLKIITVGELSRRKGTDIVAKIIKDSPKNFSYTVVGDGPLKRTIKSLTKKYNCTYLGYIYDKNKINNLYKQHDVLLFPSRAETLGLVMPEAMNYGLKVVNSEEVKLGCPEYAEFSSQSENPQEYITLLKKIFEEKKGHSKLKEKIHNYAYREFSNNVLHPQFLSKILSINI